MVTAAAIDSKVERVAQASQAARIARIEIFDDFDAAAPIWKSAFPCDRKSSGVKPLLHKPGTSDFYAH